ncbi:kinase-like domain-containing protein [Lentinula aff. detonsa]|uniref:Kinase-like domain-containing protein n=1 Tax=Lentinula aff. detonsa TaxID=2804958 RepID=A0AA38KWY1_9AGAR|nr:kinase-like domain-containing protein [Lentinula aff. detonsa]
MTGLHFIPSRLDNVEDAQEYQPGGLHPISIGDTFVGGRYRVIHKLGHGGSSTVWMARDHLQDAPKGRVVTLKALRADVSSKAASDIPELIIPRLLAAVLPPSGDLQTIQDHFLVDGPNGTHRILISPFAGLSILAMYDSPGRVSGSRRLRATLARRVARQTATAVCHMHRAGIVHGDLTTSNILFRVADHTETVRTRSGAPVGPHAPAELVAPIENSTLTDSSLLQETVVIIDFGQSYAIADSPSNHQSGTVVHYESPEARFERRAEVEADVWSLGCAIFKIRAGFPLFEPFLGSDVDILRQTVETLGKLPSPWWDSFEERTAWFDDQSGEPKSLEEQERAGSLMKAVRSSIREKLRTVGVDDDLSYGDEGPMMEKCGTRMREEEVELLVDLLEKMLKYRPQERIGVGEVLEHPWFKM